MVFIVWVVDSIMTFSYDVCVMILVRISSYKHHNNLYKTQNQTSQPRL